MTPDELLMPRYKVIAIDTTESFQIGEILNHPPEWNDYLWVTPDGKIIFYPEKYPHLFKPLQWWEDRKPEEMPQYVVICIDVSSFGKCLNVKEWFYYTSPIGEERSIGFKDHDGNTIGAHAVRPITEADYNAYLQTLTVK